MKKSIKQIIFIGSIFAFLLVLNGCGQSGPLYLPKKSQQQAHNSWYLGGGVAANKS
ncbi:MAG: lipoprotein [Gammaproteobacteria bacterium]|jgi:predicted small lipoprotein YifL